MMNSVGKPVDSATAALLVCRDADTTRGTQQLLSPIHLPCQCIPHPGHQRCIVGKVGDDRGDMRRVGQLEKRCPAFEVNQQQVEHFGRVACHHAQRDGPQQLRFARSGGSDAQAVRSHAPLRGLVDVQVHSSAVRGGTDRDTER